MMPRPTRILGRKVAREFNLEAEFHKALKAGKSLIDDIDDRIDHEYFESPVGITAQSSQRFRTIPED